MKAAGLFDPAPPEPEGFSGRVHTGPAVAQGAVHRYLLEGSPVRSRPEQPLEVAYPSGRTRLSCDVVVIGSGAGGAAAACRLAEAGLDVIVLEEGDLFTKESFTGSPITRFVRMARDAGTTAALGRSVIPIPIGKTVGGTTTINSGTCFRAPRKVLDAWEGNGLEGVGYDAMEPYFRSVEQAISVRPVPWDLLGPNGWIADAGASKLGLTGGPIMRNITDCHGSGRCAFGCPTDAKQAMHLSYLPRAVRHGAVIYARTRARWILVDEDRVTGVMATGHGSDGAGSAEVMINARAVVVACGAIGTPLFLQKNRLGLPAVGRHLRIHPAVGLAGWFSDEVFGWRGTMQQYYIDALFDSHDVMIESTNAVPSVAFGNVPGFGMEAIEDIEKVSRMSSIGLLVSDTSEGRVRRGPRGEPVITYRLNRHDLSNIFTGMALIAEVLLAAGAQEVGTGLDGLPKIFDSEGVERMRRGGWGAESLKLSAFHPMGTCSMGLTHLDSVVDTSQRVHGLEGLVVADASVFPSCIGVNPQVTIMAFALRAADLLAERLG